MKILLFSLLFFISSGSAVEIYSIKIKAADESIIDFSTFKGKPILIVNIATNSPKVSQLSDLEKIHKSFPSLVIIGFPSNSFGKEPKSSKELNQSLPAKYGVTFKIAAKGSVSGIDKQEFYKWLCNKDLNGVMNAEVKDDFQKFLISKNGELVGMFTGNTLPAHKGLIEAINKN